MASGIEHAQSSVPTCPDHEHAAFLSYCKTCERRICEICLKGPHSGHNWTYIGNHVRELRQDGQQIANRIKEEVITPLKARRKENTKEHEKAKIRRMEQTMIKIIHDYADEMVADLDEEEEGASDIDREIDEFQKLAVFFEKHISTEYDDTIMEREEELHAKLRQHRASQATAKCSVRRFQEGTIDKDRIKSMMGRVKKVNQGQSALKAGVKIERTILPEDIKSIVAVSRTSAWIHSYGSKETYLIDRDGVQSEKRGCGPEFDDFIVNGDDHVFTLAFKGNITWSSSGEITRTCSTRPLIPSGICQSLDGGMLVCLADCLSLSDLTSSSKGEGHHLNYSGNIKKKYHQDKSDHTKLFTWPWRVAQNINSDLCVSDILNTNSESRLLIVTKKSRIRSIYTGHESLKETFTVRDVVCDSSGCIILCDRYNNAIHMLNADGIFIQFILTEQNRLIRPTALALCGDSMWVGCDKGVVILCKLKIQS